MLELQSDWYYYTTRTPPSTEQPLHSSGPPPDVFYNGYLHDWCVYKRVNLLGMELSELRPLFVVASRVIILPLLVSPLWMVRLCQTLALYSVAFQSISLSHSIHSQLQLKSLGWATHQHCWFFVHMGFLGPENTHYCMSFQQNDNQKVFSSSEHTGHHGFSCQKLIWHIQKTGIYAWKIRQKRLKTLTKYEGCQSLYYACLALRGKLSRNHLNFSCSSEQHTRSLGNITQQGARVRGTTRPFSALHHFCMVLSGRGTNSALT